jgi:hypothetical protein
MSREPMAGIRTVGLVATRIGVVLVVALMLLGCGRKGNPQPPPGEPVTYPRTYPAQ